MVKPKLKNPCPGGHDIYNWGTPVPSHRYNIFRMFCMYYYHLYMSFGWDVK